MRFIISSVFVLLSFASANAFATQSCTPCQNGQRYCGDYNQSTGTWQNGNYESCSDTPSCSDQAGHSELARTYQSRTICRAVVPGSNECIRAGTANVLIGVNSCVYNNFDGCGRFLGTYEEECGRQYLSCGC